MLIEEWAMFVSLSMGEVDKSRSHGAHLGPEDNQRGGNATINNGHGISCPCTSRRLAVEWEDEKRGRGAPGHVTEEPVRRAFCSPHIDHLPLPCRQIQTHALVFQPVAFVLSDHFLPLVIPSTACHLSNLSLLFILIIAFSLFPDHPFTFYSTLSGLFS
jgi:hypothetical protein